MKISWFLAVRVLLLAFPGNFEIAQNFPVFQLPPIHYATFSGDLNFLKSQVKKNDGLNAKFGSHGITPLHVAVAFETPATKNEILKWGLGPFIADESNGGNPLLFSQILAKIQEDGTSDPRQFQTIQYLIDSGADLEEKNFNGVSPLSQAASFSPPSIVKLLIKNGANVNSWSDEMQMAPICFAAVRGNWEIFSTLFDSGADLRKSPKLLLKSVIGNNSKIVSFLLKKGIPVNPPSGNFYDYPIFQAVQKGNSKVVDLLIKAGSRIDIVDFQSRSLLHDAVIGGNAAILKSLLRAGANPSSKDSGGKTALDYSQDIGSRELEKILRSKKW